MIKKLLLLSMAICMGAISFAQNNQQEMCSSAIIHDRLMQTDPAYRARIIANEKLIQNTIMDQKANKGFNTLATLYTIPVVVHVIHLGESVGTGTNISDAQINSAITNLNDAFRNNSPYTGIDIEVQFALAQRDPNCNSTTGIVRVDGSGTSDYATQGITNNGGSSMNETAIKALSKWPNGSYYNIWIVAGIDGNMGGGGVQGYAYFPGASSGVDGAVMLYTAFGYDPSGVVYPILNSFTRYNTTFTHEMGHAFNLYHSFEGDGTGSTCPTGNQCGSTLGDCCSDTPPHQRSTSNCNPGGTNSCDGNSSNALFVSNFMDYSSDACKTEFTSEQKTRMRAAIVASRASLTTSLGATALSGSQPGVAQTCQPQTTDLVSNFGMGVFEFTLGGLTVGSGSAIADGGYVEQWCANTTLNVNTLYSVGVTNNVAVGNAEDVKVYIDYNNDGDFADAGEEIFSSNALTSHSGSFTTPASPVTGTPIWVRVISDWQANTISGPCYTPENGQVEDYSITINGGGPAPVAAFTASATTICAATAVNFTDQSTNTPTSWSWTFQGGSPSSSTVQNPSVTYTAAGTYSVSLTSTNATGSDAENKAGYITIRPLPSVTLTPTKTGCASSSGSITSSVSGGTAPYVYSWSTGGITSAIFNLAAASYTNTVTDNKGCSSTKTVTVLANACYPTKLRAAYCGITVSSLSQLVYCDYVVGASYYGYRITHAASGFSATYTQSSGTCAFSLNTVPGVGYGKTYTVEVRAYVGGVWGDYWAPCTLTTPVLVPVTKLKAAYCGITVSSLSQVVYCDYVPGVTYYGYRVTHSASGFSATYTQPYGTQAFSLNSIPGIQYGKTYTVEVRVYVGGAWGNYWAPCTLTTPAIPPVTKLMSAYCGVSLASSGHKVYCDYVPSATSYQYLVSHAASGFSATYTDPNATRSFSLSFVPGIQSGRTYTVVVRAYVNGVWGNYWAPCTLTLPGGSIANQDESSILRAEIDEIGLNDKLSIFPNPVVGRELSIMLEQTPISGEMLLEITNSLGEKMHSSQIDYHAGSIFRLPIGDNYSTGIYFVSALINNQRFYQKFVVNR